MSHFSDPVDTLIPRSHQRAQQRAKDARRREVAMACAESAGRCDAQDDGVRAAQDWRDVEALVGPGVPRVYRRARRAAARRTP